MDKPPPSKRVKHLKNSATNRRLLGDIPNVIDTCGSPETPPNIPQTSVPTGTTMLSFSQLLARNTPLTYVTNCQNTSVLQSVRRNISYGGLIEDNQFLNATPTQLPVTPTQLRKHNSRLARFRRKKILKEKRTGNRVINTEHQLPREVILRELRVNDARIARKKRADIRKAKKNASRPTNIANISQTGASRSTNLASTSKADARRSTNTVVSRRSTRNIRTRVNNASPSTDETDIAYFDIGDPTYKCPKCGALMWYQERCGGKNHFPKKPEFQLCCGNGKVKLPKLTQPPKLLLDLLEKRDARSGKFVEDIRAYNMMFSFTSMGGTIDTNVNRGRGPYCFRMGGQNHHRIGSLLPKKGQDAKFAQLYIHDTDFEDSNRVKAHGIGASKEIDPTIVGDLRKMIDEHNPFAKSFRRVEERLKQGDNQEVKLRLIGNRSKDGRMYNIPTANEVAALIVGDVDSVPDKRDIVVQFRSGELKRISELSPFYLPLQYPLMFKSGEDGWRPDIPHSEKCSDDIGPGTVTMREFTAYRIQDRDDEGPQIMLGRKLLQQYIVDSYCMVESQRLHWYRKNQKKLRVENRKNLKQSVANGDTEGSSAGKRLVLPPSFTGGARYMRQNFQDAMAICRWAGYPSLFITFTCNPKWPEITKLCERKGVRPEDRPEILARVFKMKLDELVDDLNGGSIFGANKATIYTVEFQKRGLPHAHIVVFLERGDHLNTTAHIDSVISAEIPDKEKDPELYSAVCEFMIHGPCGEHKKNSPCMDSGKCSKKFPKKFNTQTTLDDNGYPVYRRRDSGFTVEKNGVSLDNGYVVPYNRTLLLKYRAHINVEYCNQSRAIKYLFKYISKGNDRISAEVDKNEIKKYLDCRYISACEAAWRIFGFPIHYQSVPVERLQFHLEGDESCVYGEQDQLPDVTEDPTIGQLKFVKWMEMNKINAEARELKYWEFPRKFVWDYKLKIWKKRQQRFAIGRLNYVPVGMGEIYYLRVMLNHIRGPTCYEDLRTVDGVVYPTFKDACFALGLLDDDKEYIDGISEAAKWAPATYLRHLFATLLMSNSMSQPKLVWENTWQDLAEDVLYHARRAADNPDLHLTEEQLKNLALAEIEKMLLDNYSSLRNFPPMPVPDESILFDGRNKLILDEISYDKETLKTQHRVSHQQLNDDQRIVYDEIMGAVEGGKGGVFFVYGSGGTGKTFVWKTLCAALRSKGEIVLPVASSGIASLLMPRGRTAHSRFGIPINVDETSVCSKIKPCTDMTALLRRTKLIIWDEAPMTHKHCFEALDRSLRDVMRIDGEPSDQPFGGLVIVFGGDFRQILPVVPKGSRHDIVHAAICSSTFWDSCKVLKLTKNMRLKAGTSDSDAIRTRAFADWILEIGDGKAGGENDGEVDIEIPSENLIDDADDPVAAIIEDTYPDIISKLGNFQYFQDRAILAPTNEMVEKINVDVLSKLPGLEVEYKSADSVCKAEGGIDGNEEMFSVEFLNTIRCSGIPNHEIKLKVGCMIMMLRNIDQSKELCNGTRLIVTKLTPYVVEAQIITGSRAGEKILIGRMILSPSDETKYPVKFQRRQFPIAVCYGMTINKSQGQSLARVGLYLPNDVFSHGQLYVALSRVTTREGLRVLICGNERPATGFTKNVVYKEVFDNL